MAAEISFVILSYNDGERTIRAISSINNIVTKHNFDIYVVDNGSSDGTPELISKKYKNITLIRLKENTGTAAYNKAIEKSKSKYFFFPAKNE